MAEVPEVNEPESAALLGVLAEAAMTLRELTTSLRQRANVVAVDRRCDVERSDLQPYMHLVRL